MTLPRLYLALVVLGLPACAHAPPREPTHPFPLRPHVRWCLDSCPGSPLMRVIEEDGSFDVSCSCLGALPSLGTSPKARRAP